MPPRPLPGVADLHTYCSYVQFNSGCCNSCIFIARAKILARNENEREKYKNDSKTAARPQTKTNKNTYLKKNSIKYDNIKVLQIF